MKWKRHSAEQIIWKLREAGADISSGKTVAQVCEKLGVTEQTYYRGRRVSGGMSLDQAKRVTKLEKLCSQIRKLKQENDRLKKILVNQALDNATLREMVSCRADHAGHRKKSSMYSEEINNRT